MPSDTLTSQGTNLKLEKLNDLPKVAQQVHEWATPVSSSSKGLPCMVFPVEQGGPPRTEMSAQTFSFLEVARQQHSLSMRYPTNYPQRGSPEFSKTNLEFFGEEHL